MVAPKATLTLRLNKASYVLGETIEASLNISGQEDFDATELRCEILCVEEVRRIKRVFDERLRTYVDRQVQESAELYAAKPNVTGPLKMTNGYTATFPANVSLPASGRATYRSVDSKVAWFVKAVAAVNDRPDVTSATVEIQVIQPTVTVAAAQVSVQAAPVVKEVIREVVMIPCKYCGGLMPQTQTVCPNCGAKRTA